MQQHEQVRKRKLVRNMVVCSLKKRSLDKLITPTQGLSLRLSSNATPSSTEEESAHHAPPPKSQHSICCSNFEGYKDPLNSSSVHPKHKPNKENIIFNQPKYNDKDDSRLAISAEFDAKLECFELHRNLLIENWEKAEVDRVRRRTKRKNPEIWRRIQVNRATVAQDLARAPLFVAGSGRGGQWPGGGGGGARGPGAAAAAAAAAAGALCPLVVTFAAPTGGGAAAEDGADAGGLGAEAATLFFEQLPRLAAPVPPGCRRGAAGGSGGGGGEKKRPLAGATAPLPRPFLLFEVAEGGSTLLPRPYRDENGNLSPLTPELQSMYFAVGKIILRSIIQRHAVPSAVASPLLVGRCVGQPPPGGPGGGRAAALARALLAADPGYSWVVRALRTIGTTFGEILSNGDQRLIQSDADKEECLRGFIEQQVIGPRRQQFDCISRGFTANGQINISPFLKVMTDEERQLLISGDEELSLEKLWSAFEFPDDNHNCLDETTIGLLRAALARMAPRDLRRCLKFATGRGALPLPFSSSVSSSPPGGGGVGGGGGAGGAGGGQGEGGGGGGNGGLDGGGVLRVRVRAFPDGRRTGYPRVHTCTHEIEMPCYETLEELEERWMIAIQPENAAFTIL